MDSPLPVNKSNWDGRKGYDFQLNLLMLFLLRSVKTGKHHLRFSAEVEGVGAWDDILVEDKSQEKKWTLFQAKHHENTDGSKINYHVLTSMKSNYSLPKYFISFLEAQITAANHQAQIENVVICTTSDFDGKKGRFGTVSVKKNRDTKVQFQQIPNGKGQLWRKLLSMGSEINFYGITEEELWPVLNVIEVRNKIQEKHFLRQDIHTGGIDQDDFRKKVVEFSKKLIFSTQIPKLELFTEAVKQELKELITQDNIETFYSNLFARFNKWVEKLPNPIDVVSFQKVVEDVVMGHQMTELYLQSKRRHKVSGIRFRDVSTFREIIDSDKNKLKILFGNTKLLTYQLCQAMETQQLQYVEIAFSELTRIYSDILKYLHLKETEFNFVIECNDNIDLVELLKFKSKKNTFLLFQYSPKISILKQHEELEIFYSNQFVNFSEFVAESQESILNKIVKFQSKKMRLGDILSSVGVSYDVLTESFLEQLLLSEEQIEVGVPLPNIQETEPYYIPRQLLPELKQSEGQCDQWDKKNHIVLSDCSVQSMVLAADSGMGKSTFLQHAAHAIKQQYPQYLVIYINLSDHTKLLSNINKELNSEDIIEFLHFVLETEKSPIMRSILIPWLSHCQNKIVVLLDSFDEIAPTYSDKVISIIKYMTRNPSRHLYVTTRYHTQSQLEEAFKFPVYTLREFTVEDQTTFLKRYWKKQLDLSDKELHEDKFLSFAENLFRFLDRAIKGWQKKFMGIPLQTRMIADAFQDSFKLWIMGTSVKINPLESPFPDHYNIYRLYKDFLKKKWDILSADKQRKDSTIPDVADEMKLSRSQFKRAATDLAIKTIFDEVDFKTLKDLEMHFNLLMNRKRKGNKIDSHTFKRNKWAGSEEAGAEQTYTGDLEELVPIQGNDKNCKLGDNSWDSKDPFDVVSSVFTGRDGVVVVTPDGKFRFIHRTFAEYLVGSRLAKLMKHGYGPSLPDTFQMLLKKVQEEERYGVVRLFMEYAVCQDLPLHCAVLGDNIKVTRQLMQQHSHKSDRLNRSALQLAIYWERHDLICLLLRIPQPVDVFDKMNHSPITRTLVNVVKRPVSVYTFYLYVMVKIQFGLNFPVIDPCDLPNTIKEESKTRRFLNDMASDLLLCLQKHLRSKRCEKLPSLEEKTRKGFCGGYLVDLILDMQSIPTPLKTFVYNFRRNKEWFADDDVDGIVFDMVVCDGLPLHQAAIRDDNACCRWLLLGEEVNAVDVFHRTALHLAAVYNSDSSEVIQLLCESGANVNAMDVFGETPVVVAANHEHWRCVTVLLSLGASAQPLDQFTNINWDNRLYDAVADNYESVVALCLTKQANPNEQHTNGQTPLHWAAGCGYVACVELLLMAGAQTNITDEDGFTPEQLMIRNEKLSAHTKQQIQDLLHHEHQQPNIKLNA